MFDQFQRQRSGDGDLGWRPKDCFAAVKRNGFIVFVLNLKRLRFASLGVANRNFASLDRVDFAFGVDALFDSELSLAMDRSQVDCPEKQQDKDPDNWVPI